MASSTSREALLQFFRDIHSIQDLYLMGGFAEDALLDGRITRERGDVDFLVPASGWGTAHAELHEIGLRRFEPQITGPGGAPLVVVSSELGFAIELWPARCDEEGDALLLPSATGFFQLRLPADTFDVSVAALDGAPVRTVSPRALALLRATSAETRGDDMARAEDKRVFQRIVKQLLAGAEDDLIPEMTALRST